MKSLVVPFGKHETIIALLLGFLVLFWIHSRSINQQWDFGVFYLAAQVWVDGGNPYSTVALREMAGHTHGGEYHGLPFLYPPWALIFFSLFTIADLYGAAFLWLVCKCILLVAQIYLIGILVWGRISMLTWGALVIAAGWYRPIADDMASGNVTLMESTIVLASVYFYRKKKTTLSAMLICLGSCMKWISFCLLLIPWSDRNLRFAYSMAGCVFVALALILFDWGTWSAFVAYAGSDAWARHWDEQVQSVYNSSTLSLVLRTFTDTYFYDALLNAPWMVPVVMTLIPLLVLSGLWWGMKQPVAEEQPRIRFAMVLLVMLLVAPRLTGYSMVWSLYPAILTLWLAWEHKHAVCGLLSVIGIAQIQWYIAPSSVETGYEQLLLDRSVFGCTFLYIALLLCVKNRSTSAR